MILGEMISIYPLINMINLLIQILASQFIGEKHE